MTSDYRKKHFFFRLSLNEKLQIIKVMKLLQLVVNWNNIFN